MKTPSKDTQTAPQGPIHFDGSGARWQGPPLAQCDTCDGNGYITPKTGIDACPACAERAGGVYDARAP